MRSLRIRVASPAEGPALAALHRRASFVWAEDRSSLEAHPEVLGVERAALCEQRVRVAVEPGGQEIIGFATTRTGEGASCELEDLFVEPTSMRQGVGRALVEDAAAEARRHGLCSMTVVAHRRNFPFYERVGFVVGEPTPTRFGPAFRLTRRL